MKEATVILGGGAALGFAHIGVLKELEKNYKITRIIGTSMGSIVGGLYVYGMTPTEILEFGKEFKYLDFINPLNIDLKFQGLLDGSFIEKKINQKLNSTNIEETKIKYSAVAFDINSKYTVLINSGNLAKAMRASSAIPYIFNPVSVGNYLLVDGGVEYPLPCLDIQEDEFTIAVNVLPVIANKIVHLNVSSDKEGSKKKSAKKWYEIVMEALNCNQAFLVQDMLKRVKPNIFIDCDITAFLPAEFLKIEEIAKLGEEIAKESLNKE